jgi:hypothetical protein
MNQNLIKLITIILGCIQPILGIIIQYFFRPLYWSTFLLVVGIWNTLFWGFNLYENLNNRGFILHDISSFGRNVSYILFFSFLTFTIVAYNFHIKTYNK